MKRHFVLFAMFFLSLNIALPSLIVTEIMHTPIDGNEWIEFYFSGEEDLNLSGMTLSDNYQTDEIGCCNSNFECSLSISEGYFLITEKDSNMTLNNSFCVDDSAIGNGLGNSQDIIILRNKDLILLNFSYNLTTDKGLSLSYINNTWTSMFPTPGIENVFLEKEALEQIACLELEMNLPEQLFSGIEYTSPFKAINNCRKENKSLATIYYNISLLYNNTIITVSKGVSEVSINYYTTANTGNILFPEEGIYEVCGCILNNEIVSNCSQTYKNFNVSDPKKTACNISLSVWTEKKIYDKDEKVPLLFSITNTSFPFEINYWVEDAFGEIMKSSYKTKNTNQKSFSPSFDENEKAFIVKANLSFVACNNSETGFSEALFVMRSERKNTSQIEIKKIELPDKSSISFGDVAKITLYIYKGNTRKYSISVFAGRDNKKISEITTIKIPGKFNEHELTVPLMLKDNCNGRYEEGKYFIYVEGLDSEDKKEINVEGVSCKTDIIEAPEIKAQHELIFTTTNEKQIENILQVYNPDSKTHTFSIWSYLYRGSTSYSGDREDNIMTLEVPPTSDMRIILQNNFTGMQEGVYGLKIKIQRDDRKTPDEITKNISIVFPTKSVINEQIELPQEKKIIESNTTMPLTGKVVYISSSEKAKTYLPFIILITLFFIGIAWHRLKKS